MLSFKVGNCKMLLLLFGFVLCIQPHTVDGQSYFWNIGQNHPEFFSVNGFREVNLVEKTTTTRNQTDTLNTYLENTNGASVIADEKLDNKTKILIFKTRINDKQKEFSQTAMDVITIIWYVATFLALAAFFMLMACSNRRCNDAQRQTGTAGDINEPPIAPPTPSPSYSEFAPPSYDTVIKMQHAAKTSVFVVPFNNVEAGFPENKDANTTTITTTPTIIGPVTFYTINELQKLGS